MKLTHWMTIAVLAATAALALPAQQLALKDGDRVVFYGDSITAQRYYTRYVEDFFLTRYPKMNVDFFNAGVSGDNVNGGYTGDAQLRLKRDLFPHQPTVVTIMLGMNDGFYSPFEPKYLDIYSAGFHKLLDSIQSNLPGVRITVISPTPYDETTHGTEFPQLQPDNDPLHRMGARSGRNVTLRLRRLQHSDERAHSEGHEAESNAGRDAHS